MKKMLEKHGKVRSIGAGLAIVGFLLFIIAAFIKSSNVVMIMDVIGFVLFVVGGLMFTMQTKEHRVFKLLAFLAFTAFLMTWIFPYGYFQGADFYDYGMNRVGLADLGNALYYSLYFTMDKVIYLFVVAGFYGVLSKTSGYKALVGSLAKNLKKHTLVAAVVISLIITALTSLLSQTLVVLVFVPFFVAILMNMKLDKLTTFAITFGSMLIGILGATYGTDTLYFFNYYLGTEVTVGILYRLIIVLVAFFLYNFFLCMRIKKVQKEKNNEEITDVAFVPEVDKVKAKKLPVIIILLLVAIFTILGYVNWENFGLTIFTDFHKWLTELTVGEDFTVMASLLGTNAKAFGAFDLITILVVLVLASAVVALVYRVKVTDYVNAFYDGVKKMVKPVLCLIGVYYVFSICYMSPFMPTISNWALNLVDGLNPYITSLVAFITSVFSADLGYTAYSVGAFLSSVYATDLSIVHTIFVSMFGLVQIIMPTSIVLLLGLNLMKVDYKEWFKYIWLFVVGMFVILLVLFTVLVYI